MKEKHEHDFKPAKTIVLPHRRSRKSFRDTLKQYKCACGATDTVDLERKLA